METLKTILILVLGLPVGVLLTVSICIFSSLLWLIFLPWKAFDYVFDKNSESLQTFEEFIFICYGMGGIFTLIPLTVLGDDTID